MEVTMKNFMFALLLLAFTAGFLVQFPTRVFAGPAFDLDSTLFDSCKLINDRIALFSRNSDSLDRPNCAPPLNLVA
jgi:hypothetical protein